MEHMCLETKSFIVRDRFQLLLSKIYFNELGKTSVASKPLKWLCLKYALIESFSDSSGQSYGKIQRKVIPKTNLPMKAIK